MGHHLSSVILNGPFDALVTVRYDMRPIRLTSELTLFPLDPGNTDFWDLFDVYHEPEQ